MKLNRRFEKLRFTFHRDTVTEEIFEFFEFGFKKSQNPMQLQTKVLQKKFTTIEF